MVSISSVIKRRRQELDLTLAEVANRMGVSEGTVQRWESGAIKNLRHERIGRLAEVLQVSPAVLMGWEEPEKLPTPIPPGFLPMPEMSEVPIIGRVACGQPITAEENVEGVTALPSEWGADFVLICKGDSMAPKILDGDAVAIRKVEEVHNGQIAAVRIGDEATLKRVYLFPDRLELRPINPDYEDIVLTGEEMNTAAIEGRAVGLCRGI